MIPFMGVLSSCEIFTRKVLFSRSDSSACSFAIINSWRFLNISLCCTSNCFQAFILKRYCLASKSANMIMVRITTPRIIMMILCHLILAFCSFILTCCNSISWSFCWISYALVRSASRFEVSTLKTESLKWWYFEEYRYACSKLPCSAYTDSMPA